MYKRKKHGYGRGHYHHSRAVFIRAAGDVAYYEHKLYNTPIYKLLDYQSVMFGYPLSRVNRIAKRLGRLIRLNQPVPRWMSRKDRIPMLYILCGPSGSGKTTWATSYARSRGIEHVSRDVIRMSHLQEGDKYFSHEKDVYTQFVREIVNNLQVGKSVIADATHLSTFARKKLTNALDQYTRKYDITYVVFHVTAEQCIEHNKNRTGRANVPEHVIRSMANDFIAPTLEEDSRAKEIIDVWPYGKGEDENE